MKRSDEYWALKAKKEGYRSRASYKLLQLDRKHNFLKNSSLIFDLGSAPGGWSQVVSQKMKKGDKCIAIDILEMQKVNKIEFHKIDLFSDNFKNILNEYKSSADVILSDISVNLSGFRLVDDEKNLELNLFCLETSKALLNEEGTLLIKTFNNRNMKELVEIFRKQFREVFIEKPPASKTSSSEVYLLGLIPK